MKIFETVRGWWRKLFRKRPVEEWNPGPPPSGNYKWQGDRRQKKQRYSGCKSRPYIDRPLKYHHISRPLYFNEATGRVEAVPKGQGITYRRGQ